MKRTLGTLILLSVAWTTAAHAQIARISFADKPRLVRCGERPCFRLLLDATDAGGNPADLPDRIDAYRVVDLRSGKEVPAFYVAPLVNPASGSGERPIYSMLLFDLSGSMNRTTGGGESRYEAAIRVLQNFIARHFTPGVNRWAIAGFHSKNVVNGVRNARFADTMDGVLAQSRLLERPLPTNNTALYSAIEAALPMLRQEKDKGNEARVFVFTDGKNEVFPERGDDAGLLGPEGLERVRREADEERVEIITIGFGARGDSGFDEQVLQSLAWPKPSNYYYAGDEASLANVFEVDQKKLVSRVQLTVGPVAEAKNDLTSRIPLRVYVEGKAIDQDELLYVPPPMTPVYEGAIAGNEQTAFASRLGTARSGPPLVFARVLILTVYLVLFAVAWFGIPRLIWPQRYRLARARFAAANAGSARSQRAVTVRAAGQQDLSRARLEIVEGPNVGSVFTLDKDVVTIGIAGSKVDWGIPDSRRSISRHHCDIRRQGERFFLTDHSRNGTFINGQAIPMDEPVPLNRNDRITLADAVTLVFR